MPATLQGVAPDLAPLSVQVSGTPTVRLGAAAILPVRGTRQRWEYRSLSLGPADDPAVALNAVGDEGWEVTGLIFPGRAGTTVVLKRPR